MEQVKAFIEKAKTDSELMAKLDALGRKGAEAVDEVIALAAEYGFTVTKEDAEAARCETCPRHHHGELSEYDLAGVSGGGWTSNRYDPAKCPSVTRTNFDCIRIAIFTMWCDHLRRVEVGREESTRELLYQFECVMGSFKYIGYASGEPRGC